MALDTSFNRVVATTLPLYAPRVMESIVGSIALLWKMAMMDGVETRPGGTQIVEPTILTTNTTVKAYTEFQTLDTTLQSDPNAASYLWKIIAGTEGLSLLEQGKNSNSATAPVDLWDAIINRLALSMRIEVNRELFLDGTGSGGAELTGLGIGLDFAGTNSVYGNIDSATFVNWRNQTRASPALNVLDLTTPANQTAMVRTMRQLANDCSSQNEWPTMYITSKEIHEAWESTVVLNERFQRESFDEDMVRSGFQNFIFKGGVLCFDDHIFPNTLSASPSATAGHGFLALNLKYLKFVMMENFDFVMSDPIRPFDQMADVIQMILHANMVMNNRRRHGRVNFRTA
jgi:hypothetical protein